MKKIPTMFVRDEEDRRHVTSEITPGCEWVVAGEGLPTRKFDGVCVLVRRDALVVRTWVRRQLKEGQEHPPGFVPIEFDEQTRKLVGWEPSEQSGFKKWIDEALSNMAEVRVELTPGTYELIGPKVNQNPEGMPEHWLFEHGLWEINAPDRSYSALRNLLTGNHWPEHWEGIVFRHDDGRMAKIKRKDFL